MVVDHCLGIHCVCTLEMWWCVAKHCGTILTLFYSRLCIYRSTIWKDIFKKCFKPCNLFWKLFGYFWRYSAICHSPNCIIIKILLKPFCRETLHMCTKIEIHFIAFYIGHTQALSRHSNKSTIDKQVCFYRQLFSNPVKSQRTKTDPVRPLRGINRVVWGPIIFYSMSVRLMVWSGGTVAICLSCWTNSLVSCVSLLHLQFG